MISKRRKKPKKPKKPKTEAELRDLRDYRLREEYGIGLEDVERMFVDQDGKCAICERPGHLGRRREVTRMGVMLCVDHCHQTGHVRGLLCHRCNLMVGNNSPRYLVRGAFYVQEAEKRYRRGESVA